MIARTRHSIPGITLISPPPHHDIYSIEDLAQLIFDLKNVNPEALVSVKLVAERRGNHRRGRCQGEGRQDSDQRLRRRCGCQPRGFDEIRGRSGRDRTCGDSADARPQPASRPGAPASRRAAEMRPRRAGQRPAGAEEYGFGTAALVALGCRMLRKCHTNTCPMGVATQDPQLRERFTGTADRLINYFRLLAEDIRRRIAELGYERLTI